MIPIRYTTSKLPFGYIADPKKFFLDFIKNTRMYVSGEDVIIGNNVITLPNFNAGPSFFNAQWFTWSDDALAYTRDRHLLKNGAYNIELLDDPNATPGSGSVTAYFPDKSGTVALTTDVFVPRPTTFFDASSGSLAIDGSVNNNFYGRLTQNTTISSLVMPDGELLKISVLNIGTSFTLTWPAAIQWPGGTEPTQPIAGTTGASMGKYHIKKLNGVYYGRLLAYGVPPSRSGDAGNTPPPSNYGYHGGNIPPQIP